MSSASRIYPWRVGLVGLALMAGCAEAPDTEPIVGPVAVPVDTTLPPVNGRMVTRSIAGANFYSADRGIAVWQEPGFRQTLFCTDFSKVEVLDEWLGDDGSVHGARTHSAEAPFSILRMSSAGSDVFCFAGMARDSSLVVERWDLVIVQEKTGSDESPRLPAKAFERTRIHSGPWTSGLVDAGIDPQRRFLLVLMGEADRRVLYRFANHADADPELVLDSADTPELAGIARLVAARHVELGTCWKLIDDSFRTQLLLVESEVDGALEGEPLVRGSARFEASGVDDYESWVDLHRTPR